MRKDVRMGFAVGGVLLTVLVVAILVFHRNKNTDKTVAFDSGGKSAVSSGTDLASTDSTPPQDGAAGTVTSPAQAPAPAVSNTPSESKAPADEPAEKGGARWDALFASTAADPIKAQLTSDTLGKPRNKSKKHRSDAATADMTERHDTPAMPAVANAPLETNPPATPEASRARPIASERLTSQAPRESGRTHVVASGETFVSIARAVYGDGRYYQALIDANPSVDPNKLKPGISIQLPPDSQVKQSRKSSKSSSAASSSSSATDGKTYTVQNGDSLYKIAKKLYGSGEKSDELYEANKQTIGPDSTRLKIGMILTLPESPTVR
jgi:nucleoid-associated protein YgaU